MFKWLTGQAQEKKLEIRDTLFGDLPLGQCQPKSPAQGKPWTSFARVKECLDRGDKAAAVSILQSILAMPDLESRHYLEAWSFLRDLGVFPPKDKAKDVLGVVVEVGMDRGLDLVAAYPDHHARYYNFSGAGVVWERPNNSLDKPIDDLLRAASDAVKVIGPWDKERPLAPPSGQVRINILTPSGLHFGQGPFAALSKDRIGGPVLGLAFQLMQKLIQLTKKS
jgi:hypothetical protein